MTNVQLIRILASLNNESFSTLKPKVLLVLRLYNSTKMPSYCACSETAAVAVLYPWKLEVGSRVDRAEVLLKDPLDT